MTALLDVASYLALAEDLAEDEHAVTHELSVVQALCRRVAIVEDGRIAEEFEVREADGGERRTLLGRELGRLVRRKAREARIEAEEAAEEERRAAAASAAAPNEVRHA